MILTLNLKVANVYPNVAKVEDAADPRRPRVQL